MPFFMFHVKHYFISREIFYAIFYIPRGTLFYFLANILCHFLCSTWNIILFSRKYFMPSFTFHVERYFIFQKIFIHYFIFSGTLLIFQNILIFYKKKDNYSLSSFSSETSSSFLSINAIVATN